MRRQIGDILCWARYDKRRRILLVAQGELGRDGPRIHVGKRRSEKMILHGRYPSLCCNRPTILVRSRVGGFVTQNCSSPKCPEPPSKVVLSDLPVLHCAACKAKLVPFKRQNYFYACENCQLEWELPLMLPHWDELFDYNGFGLPTDDEQFAVYLGPNPLVIALPGQKRASGNGA